MFPRMAEVRPKIPSAKIEDFIEAIRDELRKKNLHGKIKSGWRIAITAGSRGMAYCPEILAKVVEEVKKAGANHS